MRGKRKKQYPQGKHAYDEKQRKLRKDTIFRVAAFFTPLFIYVMLFCFVIPVPNSGFLFLGCLGCILLGFGLCLGGFAVSKVTVLLPALPILFGILMIAASALILCAPALYAKFDEKAVTECAFGWMVILLLSVWYPFFRIATKSSLRETVPKKELRTDLRGFKNFLWYHRIHEKYDISTIYIPNKIYTVLLSAAAIVHLCLGWLDQARTASLLLLCVVSVITSYLGFYSARTPVFRRTCSTSTRFILIFYPLFILLGIIFYIAA